MKLLRYRKYKPSGVEWFPDVPEHWTPKRLKIGARCWVSNVDKVPAEDELPVRLCNYTDVYYNEQITPDMSLMETTATAEEIRKFHLEVNDVVITKDSEEWSDIAVPALIAKTADDLVCGYHLGITRPNPDQLCGEYLLRAFQACAVNQQFQVAATGVTRYGLPKSAIGDAWIPFPPPEEQKAIADFLDGETARLDTLVGKKRELIEKLKEKRTALISRTVTQGLPAAAATQAGLNPHPKLKSSGIEWLGNIPKHWEVKAVRHVATRIQTGSTPPTAEEEYYQDGSVPWFGPGSFDDAIVLTKPVKLLNAVAVKDGAARLFHKGATLIVTIGATLGKVSSIVQDASCNQQITVIEVRKNVVHPRFITYQLKRLETTLRAIAPSATLPILAQDEIARLLVAFPAEPEQRAIADFVDRETAKIDKMIEKVESAIEKLQEYRTALITAAVTGKIDVRRKNG